MPLAPQFTFARLTDVPPEEILVHMSDPKVAEHMPLLKGRWDMAQVERFIAAKEACWQRDGLGHWAILQDDTYIGWGGFQKEGDEWDFGLVLKPDCFGVGLRIINLALDFARSDERIPFVTALLPPSRRHFGLLKRKGARFQEEVDYEGDKFLKFRLDTS